MASLDMNGPYALNQNSLTSVVNDNGNYAVGYKNQNGEFVPKYVGRGNVYDRLYAHLTDEYTQPYFMFSYAKTEEDACNKECKNYHDFKSQLMNKEHPKLPKSKKCPYCTHVGV